jgi:hypothetical protein
MQTHTHKEINTNKSKTKLLVFQERRPKIRTSDGSFSHFFSSPKKVLEIEKDYSTDASVLGGWEGTLSMYTKGGGGGWSTIRLLVPVYKKQNP